MSIKDKKLHSVFMDNILPLLAGVSLALPFTYYQAGWLVLISSIPFIYSLQHLSRKSTPKQIMSSVWLSGVVFSLFVMSWMVKTTPYEWTSLEGWQGTLVFLVVYFIAAFFLSTQFIFFGWLYVKTKVILTAPSALLILPAIWATSELLRSLLFSVLVFGQGGSIGLQWNFGVLGFAGIVTPLGYLSRFVGLYGLSFVITAINLALFWVIYRKFRLPLVISLVILLSTTASYLVFLKPNGREITVAAIQHPVPNQIDISRASYANQLQAKFAVTSDENLVDTLVMPEYSGFFEEGTNQKARELVAARLKKESGIITSVSDKSTRPAVNRLTVYSKAGEVINQQPKRFLIPFGEYMPYVIELVLKVAGQQKAIDDHKNDRLIDRGATSEYPVKVGKTTVGALVCSGTIVPELYREMTQSGAEILTNSASLSTFRGADIYNEQTRQMAHSHAVANARTFVQASSGTYSYIIDHNGNELERTEKTGLDYLQSNIVTNARKTPYTLLGEWVVAISLVGIAYVVIRNYRNDN